MWAANRGNFETVELLLKKGADPNVFAQVYIYTC